MSNLTATEVAQKQTQARLLLDHAFEVEKDMERLHSQLAGIVSDLVGSEPPSDVQAADSFDGDGAFPATRNALQQIDNMISVCRQSLDRLG